MPDSLLVMTGVLMFGLIVAIFAAVAEAHARIDALEKRAKEEQNNQLREGNPFISERTRPWYL